MTEMGELSVEDQLRDELRTVRHDLEHVIRERNAAEWQVQVLQDRIAKAAQILRDCAHDSDGMCGYGQKALAALDGEGEKADADHV